MRSNADWLVLVSACILDEFGQLIDHAATHVQPLLAVAAQGEH